MERTITVTGIGQVSAPPDCIRLTMELNAKGLDYENVMALADRQLKDLRHTIMQTGMDENELKTCNFSVDTEYKYERDSEGNNRRLFDGYLCRHSLSVTFDFDVSRLGKILSALSACAAKPQFQIGFFVKDQKLLIDRILRNAAADAQKKAELLCDELNVKLGKLTDVRFASYGVGAETRGVASFCAEGVTARRMDLQPKEIQANDCVICTWEIE